MNRVCEIVGNANIGNIDTFLSQGHDMEYIARHFQMDLALTLENVNKIPIVSFL